MQTILPAIHATEAELEIEENVPCSLHFKTSWNELSVSYIILGEML
jgi:hypothetical protein